MRTRPFPLCVSANGRLSTRPIFAMPLPLRDCIERDGMRSPFALRSPAPPGFRCRPQPAASRRERTAAQACSADSMRSAASRGMLLSRPPPPDTNAGVPGMLGWTAATCAGQDAEGSIAPQAWQSDAPPGSGMPTHLALDRLASSTPWALRLCLNRSAWPGRPRMHRNSSMSASAMPMLMGECMLARAPSGRRAGADRLAAVQPWARRDGDRDARHDRRVAAACALFP